MNEETLREKLKKKNGRKEILQMLEENSKDIIARLREEQADLNRYSDIIEMAQKANKDKILVLKSRRQAIIDVDPDSIIDNQEIDELDKRIKDLIDDSLALEERLADMQRKSAEKQKEFSASLKAQTEAIKQLGEKPEWVNFLIGGVAKGVISAVCIALAYGAKCVILDKGGMDKNTESLFNGFGKSV